jgi:hypothetical protein
MSPVATPVTAPALVDEHLGCREPGIDLDAERLGLGGEPLAQVAQARDVVAMVVHQPRQRPVRNPVRLVRGQDQEPVLDDRRVQRGALGFPVGNELGQAARIDDGARQDVSADLRAFLDEADGDVAAARRGELLDADGGGEARGTAADDHDVVFHRFARHRGIIMRAFGRS